MADKPICVGFRTPCQKDGQQTGKGDGCGGNRQHQPDNSPVKQQIGPRDQGFVLVAAVFGGEFFGCAEFGENGFDIGFIRRFSAAALLAAALLASQASRAQEGPAGGAVLLKLDDAGSYTLVERSDWARYDDGRYVGHVYREVRGSLAASGGTYRGSFYVLEETLRDMRAAALAVDGGLVAR